MRITITFLAVMAFVNSQAQLVLNSDNGFLEHGVIIESEESLFSRLDELNLDPSSDLRVNGSFSHMVGGFAPVEISYIGKKRDDNYVLTNFKVMGGDSNAWVKIEDLPKKHQKKWTKVINEKIEKLRL